MARYLSFITLLVVIVLLIILFYKVMAGFFVPLFLAALLVVIFRPMHVWFVGFCKGRKQVAALLTTASILLCVLVPLAILFALAAFESQQMVRSLDKDKLLANIGQARNKLNLTQPDIAVDLQDLEYRLINIAEQSRLEDIRYLANELNNTHLYNQEIGKELQDESPAIPAWEAYSEAFNELRAVQSQIANPEYSESELEEETDIPATMLHLYQQKLETVSERFADFRTQALGGSPFWNWVRDTANPTPELLEEYGADGLGFVRDFLVGLGATTTTYLFSLLFGAAIMIFSTYFFLLDGPSLLESLKQLSPIDEKHEQELIDEFSKVSRAVVVATLLAALVQALLGGIGYYFAGLESVFLLTLLTGCFALVPFFGAATVWVPCALWLFFVDNNATAAIGLAIYGLAVISMADNFIKPLVLHGQSNLHPLFALLSILGGVSALGPIGILIGPMIVAFLQTLLKLLQRELVTLDQAINDQAKTT